jgi:hypothetical protein
MSAAIKRMSCLIYGIISFNITKEMLYNKYGITDAMNKAINDVVIYKGMRSYFITDDGFFFRSDAEYTLYKKLINLGVVAIDVNKSYPPTPGVDHLKYFYDLCMEINGDQYYIEICGIGEDDPIYYAKQLEKARLYGSILVGTDKIFKFIKDVKDGKDFRSINYY